MFNPVKALSPIFLVWASLLIIGCASQPQVTPPAASATLADTATYYDLQLAEIDSLIADLQLERAQLMLNMLNFSQLTTAQQMRFVLLNGDIALSMGDGKEALRWLSGDYTYLLDGLPMATQVDIGLKRAQAHEISGNPLAAARERIFIAPVLSEDAWLLNHNQIWFDLQLVDQSQLRMLAARESSPDLRGWLQLSLISLQQSNDLYGLLAEIARWQQRWPNHPAAVRPPASLSALAELAASQPRQVAVLLPLSGRLQAASNAIRNGLLAAWYQARNEQQPLPELAFYDTALADDIVSLYRQAVSEGAELVIGPLEKNKVTRLAAQPSLSVPVLALNYLDKGAVAPSDFYQFGLAPEDEAVQIANDVWQQGFRSVLVIAPQSDQGVRVSDAFIEQWQLQGGALTGKVLFNQPDQYLSAVKQALNVQLSEQRHARMQRLLDTELEFAARRRQDVDLVFMHAFPAQARQLKPILNYQRATEVPVVATSFIYSGAVKAERDKDLNGVQFLDMPWRLQPEGLYVELTEVFPESSATYQNLTALGVDAYRLHPRLAQMIAYADVRIAAATGSVSMTSAGKIQRRLNWAIIDNGRVEQRPLFASP